MPVSNQYCSIHGSQLDESGACPVCEEESHIKSKTIDELIDSLILEDSHTRRSDIAYILREKVRGMQRGAIIEGERQERGI